MPDAEDTAENTVVRTLRSLLRRRNRDEVEVTADSTLYDDLALDSLETAEFSAVLEDELGTDPYSEGQMPTTVAEVLEFYDR